MLLRGFYLNLDGSVLGCLPDAERLCLFFLFKIRSTLKTNTTENKGETLQKTNKSRRGYSLESHHSFLGSQNFFHTAVVFGLKHNIDHGGRLLTGLNSGFPILLLYKWCMHLKRHNLSTSSFLICELRGKGNVYGCPKEQRRKCRRDLE